MSDHAGRGLRSPASIFVKSDRPDPDQGRAQGLGRSSECRRHREGGDVGIGTSMLVLDEGVAMSWERETALCG
jgi:hypothetical protein